MHVGEIMQADCANGVGIRLSLFVSGCTNRCKGCFNEQNKMQNWRLQKRLSVPLTKAQQ